MTDIGRARDAVIARILEGEGEASRAQRHAAFENAGLNEPLRTLIDNVAKRAYKVTDEEIAGARASGVSENEIFELVICAAIGQASRQYDAAVAALEAATASSTHTRRNGLIG